MTLKKLSHNRMVRAAKRTALLVAFLVAATLPAKADYLIQSGDTLELSVAGLPDLRQRGVVGPDGEITLPFIQSVKVANMSLAEAQRRVKDLLSTRVYQQRGPDGRESATAISPDAVTLTVAEYRPVYLNGDVTRPGAQQYRPGMTVRQAVALAGGYEIMRFRMNNPFLESADLRAEYQSLWSRYAVEQGRIWRLRTELDPNLKLSLEEMTNVPIPASALESLRNLAKQELSARAAKRRAERDFLQNSLARAKEQIAILNDRRTKDDEGAKADAAEYERLREFSERGQLPMTRLSESRRLLLLSSTQSLQTTVQLTTAQQQSDEVQRRISRIEEDRRLEVTAEIQQADEAASDIRAKLQAVSEKISYTGLIRSQLTRGGRNAPSLRIFRAQSKAGSIPADENTEVLPGDTIEVALDAGLPDVPANQ
jgi:polysaccharide biosynthesis/export protein